MVTATQRQSVWSEGGTELGKGSLVQADTLVQCLPGKPVPSHLSSAPSLAAASWHQGWQGQNYAIRGPHDIPSCHR